MKGDTISRTAAINALRRRLDETAKGDIARFFNTIIGQDIECIEQLPSAEPKRGKWIEIDPPSIYLCPFCGADMRGEE